MSKLPADFVKAPVFDSPLRKTAAARAAEPSALSVVPDEIAEPVAAESQPESTVASPETTPTAPPSPAAPRRSRAAKTPTPSPEPAASEYRATVRLPRDVYLALETESHRRRIAGQKASVASLMRDVLERWAARNAP